MKILLGISASISAYKACDLVRQWTKEGHEVKVIMTKHATELVSPLTLKVISKQEVGVSMMEEENPSEIQHITLAQTCDVFVIAPASANIIGKLANGIADDLLSTIALAVPQHTAKYIAPAMNTIMYQNPAVQRNLQQLKEDGYQEIEPRSGELACGVTGKGALAEISTIIDAIKQNNKK